MLDTDLMTLERPPNTQRLIEIGEALHGERWALAVAKALGVDEKQVRRWVKGEAVPSAEVMAKLEEILEARIARLEAIRGKPRRKKPAAINTRPE